MKLFKKMSFLIFIAYLSIFLGACSSDSTMGNNRLNEFSQSDSDNVIKIRFAHGAAEDNPRHEAALKFKELVEERSNNEIQVEIFPNEILGSEPQMVESVEFNEIEMVAASTFSQYVPEMDVFALPFLFDSNEQAWEVLDGPIGQEVAEPLLDYNLRVLAHMENGMRHITNNKRPIETVEDVKDMVIRVPEIPMLISIFESIGTNPTPMAFGELYVALQQGTVDGQENPITNIHASKFYEVQKYLSLTGHSYSFTTIAISDAFWQTLSPEHQEIIDKTAKEIAQWHREKVVAEEEKLLAEVEEYGMEINTPDKESFREASMPVYEKYEEVFGKDLIDKVLEAVQ